MKTKSLLSKTIAGMLALLIVGMAAFALTSCGSKSVESSKSKESNDEFDFPESGIAKVLPNPEAKRGEVTYDSSDSLDVDIYDYSEKDFKGYVEKCKQAGFDKDYTGWEDYYSAENKDGYDLMLDYEKEKSTMSISLYAPDDDEDETKATTKPKSKTSSKAKTSSKSKTSSKAKKSTGVSADFKKTMDDYEAFMNEYVEFMKKYNDSDDALGMLSEYTDMMSKYSDFTKKIDNIDEDSLSTDDYAYYLDVITRVNKKLLEVAA